MIESRETAEWREGKNPVAFERKESSAHASLRIAAAEPLFSQTALQSGAAVADTETNLEAEGTLPEIKMRAETRMYRGAIYERGDDGQWHLQQK